MEILNIFKQLKKLNSVKDKESLLKANKSNVQLLELLKAGLDKNRLFQFNKMPDYDNKDFNPDNPKYTGNKAHDQFLLLLDKLENREVTGKLAKEAVIEFISNTTVEEEFWYSKILCKKALGVSAKTVNKVWPGAIEEFNLMLGPNELPDVTSLDYPLFIQPKRDGYRCVFKDGELITRHGKKFKNKNLKNHFKCLNKASNYVLDGELYMHGRLLSQHTEIFNSFDAILPPELKFYIFDVIPLVDWENQVCTRPYKARIKDIRVITNELIAEPRKVIDVHTEEVHSASEAIEYYKKYLTKGYEGGILRNRESLYKWKRTTVRSGELIKLKPKETVDAKIVEILKGEGDFTGMAGSVVAISDSDITFSCSSGLTVAQRKDMAKQPNNYIGKTIEVSVMGKSSKGSYRDPRFKRFRPDKDK